jgi:hypothetical protein
MLKTLFIKQFFFSFFLFQPFFFYNFIKKMTNTTVKEMTTASWKDIGSIALTTKNVPILKPGEVLIRVAASGICGK